MIGGQKTAAAALLISVFLAGALGGVVGTKLLEERSFRERGLPPSFSDRRGGAPPPWIRGPDMMGDRRSLVPMWLSRRLTAELDLDESQQEELKVLLETRRERAEEDLAELMPNLMAQMDSLLLEIRRILTPEQQTLFDRYRKGEDARIFGRRPTTFPGTPPGGFH